MILVDTSIWIDHLHRGEPRLIELLDAGDVVTHSRVVEELALGSIHDRQIVLQSLADLPMAPEADHSELLVFVEANALYGVGLSPVDASLLAACRLQSGLLLWTRDRRLATAAERLGVAAA